MIDDFCRQEQEETLVLIKARWNKLKNLPCADDMLELAYRINKAFMENSE